VLTLNNLLPVLILLSTCSSIHAKTQDQAQTVKSTYNIVSEPSVSPSDENEIQSTSNDLVLTESILRSLIEKTPPSVQQIEASFLDSKRADLAAKDKFALSFEAEGQVFKSQERLLNNFDAVTQNATNYTIGLVKPTEYGVDLSLKAFGDKITNAFVSGASTNGVIFGLSVDLYQDFFGRKTKWSLKQADANFKKAKLEKEVELKTFEANLRKMYWSLVSNEEKKILMESLVKTAEQQLSDAMDRRRSGVTDDGEIARFKSQLSSRKANLIGLAYEKSEISKNLRELLPELSSKKLLIKNYDVNLATQKVFECIALINSQSSTPLEYTLYDEIVDLLIEDNKYQQKIIGTYNDIDVKLSGEYSNVGRDFSFEGARQDFADDPRARSNISLKVSMPLDGKKTKTKEVTEQAYKNKIISVAQGHLSKIDAFHTETIQIIGSLRDILKSQKETSQYLGQSLQESRKKFNQGRTSLQELISEQDAQVQNKLNEIDSNLIIVNTIIDYFSIYTTTPCDFNRI
jgi:outer membrane protein TolC